MKHFLQLIVVLALLALVVAPVTAGEWSVPVQASVNGVAVGALLQETPPADSVTGQVPTLEETVTDVEGALGDLLNKYGIYGSALVLFIVAALKRVKQLENVKVETITLGVAFVITLLTWIARRVGVEVELNSLLKIVETVGPAFLNLFGVLIGSTAFYSFSKRLSVPVVGSQRPVKAG